MANTTKADLAAANREVRDVMNQNAILKKQAEHAYNRGWQEAAETFHILLVQQLHVINALIARLGGKINV